MRVKKQWFSLLITGALLVSGLGTVYAEGPLKGMNQIPSIPNVVARVNGSEIPAKYIKFEFMRALRNVRAPMTSPQKDKMVRKIIDKEVVRELMYQEGHKLNLKADPKVVESELESLRSAYKNNEEFNKALDQRNITESDLKRSIEVDALARVILEKQVKGKVKIDDTEVHKYYDDNKESFHRPEAFRVSHVLISPFPPDLIRSSKIEELQAKKGELEKKAREKILEVQKEMKGGADIAELAKKYSHDEVSAENGGDLGFFYAEGVEKSFAEAVEKLKVGEVTDVVETKFGFHLIKLTGSKPSEYAPFKDMEEAIQKQLFMEKAQDRVADYVASLRKKAKIEVLY
ncbi:MAG: peptidylprolyl isomerase [Nitrospinaceae bacterium]|nr:peptidylprolyl isomerase [Nitrospinaceae bacterium]MDP7147284.1 peptidylprolyl isomerase [Nitrospinaceae bacterium]MEE1550515.1 peptidylprolyl isomerase [Nitrospinaceae bacterium]